MKSSFRTTSYKNGFIHESYNSSTRSYEYSAQVGAKVIPCHTLLGAKRAITKELNYKEWLSRYLDARCD